MAKMSSCMWTLEIKVILVINHSKNGLLYVNLRDKAHTLLWIMAKTGSCFWALEINVILEVNHSKNGRKSVNLRDKAHPWCESLQNGHLYVNLRDKGHPCCESWQIDSSMWITAIRAILVVNHGKRSSCMWILEIRVILVVNYGKNELLYMNLRDKMSSLLWIMAIWALVCESWR